MTLTEAQNSPGNPYPGRTIAEKRPRPAVAVLLSRRLLTQAQAALGRSTDLLQADSWDDLERLIKERPLRAVIVDPGFGGPDDADWVVQIFTRYPSLPVIAYVSLDPASFSAIARLARFGLEHVVLHRFDDSVERFNTIVENGSADPLVHRVLDGLAPSLDELPLALSIAVKDLFNEPHRFHTAVELSAGTSISILQMYLSFKAANLACPKRFVTAARTLRAFTYLRDPGYSVVDAALKLGYIQPRVLTSHSVMVFGLTLLRARQRLSDDEAVKRVLNFLQGHETMVVRNAQVRRSHRVGRSGRPKGSLKRVRPSRRARTR